MGGSVARMTPPLSAKWVLSGWKACDMAQAAVTKGLQHKLSWSSGMHMLLFAPAPAFTTLAPPHLASTCPTAVCPVCAGGG